jgi:hypothetical protein
MVHRCILIATLLLTGHAGYSQYNKLRGSKSFQAGFGFHDAGLLANAYSLKTFDQKIKAGVGGGVAFGRVSDISYKAVFLDGVGSFAMRSTRLVSFNALAGLTFIGDFKNEFPSERYSKNFNFNYGMFGGCEFEFVATKRMSFLMGGTYRYYLRSDFGSLRYHLSAALRGTL